MTSWAAGRFSTATGTWRPRRRRTGPTRRPRARPSGDARRNQLRGRAGLLVWPVRRRQHLAVLARRLCARIRGHVALAVDGSSSGGIRAPSPPRRAPTRNGTAASRTHLRLHVHVRLRLGRVGRRLLHQHGAVPLRVGAPPREVVRGELAAGEARYFELLHVHNRPIARRVLGLELEIDGVSTRVGGTHSLSMEFFRVKTTESLPVVVSVGASATETLASASLGGYLYAKEATPTITDVSPGRARPASSSRSRARSSPTSSARSRSASAARRATCPTSTTR